MKPCGCARVAHQWNLFQGRAPMRSCGPILHWPLHTRLRSWKPKRYRPPTRLRSCGGCEWCVTRGFLLSAYVEYTNQLCFQRITTLASLCPLHHCPFISVSLSPSLSLSISPSPSPYLREPPIIHSAHHSSSASAAIRHLSAASRGQRRCGVEKDKRVSFGSGFAGSHSEMVLFPPFRFWLFSHPGGPGGGESGAR